MKVYYFLSAILLFVPRLLYYVFLALLNAFRGYDIFISYSRGDGYLLANKNSAELARKNFTCFIDQWENEPGEKLSPRLKNRLLHSRMLLIVGTTGSFTSIFVKEEIELFLQSKRQIIPISFGTIESANWYPLVKGLPIIHLSYPESLENEIDKTLIDRVASSFKHVRRLKLLNISYLSIFALLLMAAFGVFYMWQQVKTQKAQNKDLFIYLQKQGSQVRRKDADLDTIAARSARSRVIFRGESAIQSLKMELKFKDAFLALSKSELAEYKKAHKNCDYNSKPGKGEEANVVDR